MLGHALLILIVLDISLVWLFLQLSTCQTTFDLFLMDDYLKPLMQRAINTIGIMYIYEAYIPPIVQGNMCGSPPPPSFCPHNPVI